MKNSKFYFLAFAPVFIMIGLALSIQFFKIESFVAPFKSLFFVGFTSTCGLILYFSVSKLGLVQKAPDLKWGTIRSAIATGVLTSNAVALSILLHSLFSGISLNFQFTQWTPSFLWFSSSFLAPVIEELAFRAGLLRLLLPAMKSQYAVILSATVFAGLHVMNIFLGSKIDGLQILGCFLIGIILANLYLRYGLLSAIACHWLWNLVQIPLLRGMLDTSGDSITMFEGLPSVLTVLVLKILILNFNSIRDLLFKSFIRYRALPTLQQD